MDSNNLKEKIKANLIPIIVVGLGVVLIFGGLIYNKSKKKSLEYAPQSWNDDGTVKEGVNCDTTKETVKVSAAGSDIFEAGTEVEVEMNYYACNKGERDQIVMIKSPGRDEALFKYIKMVPGDKFSVIEKNKKFNVIVNGNAMENPRGEIYGFTERKSRMIKLYESNFKDGIKQGVYFVFGESPAGGFDSTRFGPVTSERMIGRVLTEPSSEKK